MMSIMGLILIRLLTAAGFFQDLLQGDGGAVFPFTFISSLHKGKNLQRFILTYRRLTGFEESGYLFQQGHIPLVGPQHEVTVFTVNRTPVFMFSGARTAEGSYPAVLPHADNQVGTFGMDT